MQCAIRLQQTLELPDRRLTMYQISSSYCRMTMTRTIIKDKNESNGILSWKKPTIADNHTNWYVERQDFVTVRIDGWWWWCLGTGRRVWIICSSSIEGHMTSDFKHMIDLTMDGINYCFLEVGESAPDESQRDQRELEFWVARCRTWTNVNEILDVRWIDPLNTDTGKLRSMTGEFVLWVSSSSRAATLKNHKCPTTKIKLLRFYLYLTVLRLFRHRDRDVFVTFRANDFVYWVETGDIAWMKSFDPVKDKDHWC